MSQNKKTEISVSPWAVVLMALFIWFTSPSVLAAVLLAAVCHELAHGLVLRRFGAAVERICITPLGAEISVASRPTLSYSREILAVAAGPAVNLVLAFLLAQGGQWKEELYLFSGAQLILGGFNLLPMRPLDGGTIMWLTFSWGMDPVAADRAMRWIERIGTALLLLFSVWLWQKSGTPFLCLAAFGLWKQLWPEKKLVKGKKRR